MRDAISSRAGAKASQPSYGVALGWTANETLQRERNELTSRA
jgi:hypothetical protein